MKKILKSIFIVAVALFVIIPCNKVFAQENFNKINENINLENFNQFNIIDANNYYCVNTQTNKIFKVNNNNVESFGEYGNQDGQFAKINHFKVLKNNELIVIDNLNRLQFFDTNFTYKSTVQYVLEEGVYSNLGNITSVCDDIYGNLYMLDSTNNRILKANSQNQYASVFFKSEENISIFNINTLNNLVLVNQNTLTLQDKTINLEVEINNIYIDALNYIYLLSGTNILKYNSNLELQNTFENNNNIYYNLNIENGIFYSINPTTLEIEETKNIASDVLNYEPPVDIFNLQTNTEKLSIAKLSTDSFIYASPFSTTSNIKLSENSQIIVLSSNFSENLNFSYILYEYNNNAQIGYVLSNNYSYINLTQEEILTPIRKQVPFYKFPAKEINGNSMLLGTLDFEKDYNSISFIKLNNLSFYEIQLDSNYVYVQEYNLLNTQNEYINTYLETNATIKMYNQVKSVKIYSTLQKDEIQNSISKTLNVRLIKKINDMCEIQYLDNNTIVTGYVESKYIVKNNTNFTIPIIICAIIILLIILSIIIIKFKKEFKQKA